jgi:stage II sporulation protein AA (anti-sigma F factor antagonist)
VIGATVAIDGEGAERRFTIVGEIDMANCAEVQAELFASISNQLEIVVVDLGGVTYVDSSGIRLLFELTERLRDLQVSLEVDAPAGSPARRVIEVSGLGGLIPLVP